jgi:2-polyprenyl-6-methoxyphenol hydroxylase-like FAD-dependent oxidoreductase
MRETFPDVFEMLLEAGAWDVDLRPKIRGGATAPGDGDLAYLAARRPLIEWAMRRAVLAEPRVAVIGGTRATGFAVSGNRAGPARTIIGVHTDGGSLPADLVIDAMGRRSPAHAWLAAAGGRPMDMRSTECSIIYYSRYYRVRDGATLPETPSIPGPRGDLGYGAFSTFPGDNRTFAALIATPPGDQALKAVRDVRAFEAATRTMPALDTWTNPETSEPITAVLPMGSLQNTLRTPQSDRPTAVGLISVGDSICHTDPVASLGLSFAFIHARHLATVLRDHNDPHEAALAFHALAGPEMEERFGYLSAIDDTRLRLWSGEKIDYSRRDGGAYPFFTFAANGIATLAEADVFRAVVRRNTFLDPLAVLDLNVELQTRLEDFYSELAAANRPRPGPPRDELLDVMAAATAGQA